MQPLSNDLRSRILNAVDNREGSRRKLAVRFEVNTSTITKLLRLRRETGSLAPRPHGGGVEPTLDRDARLPAGVLGAGRPRYVVAGAGRHGDQSSPTAANSRRRLARVQISTAGP